MSAAVSLSEHELERAVRAVGEAARKAAFVLAEAGAEARSQVLRAAASLIRTHAKGIAEANGSDIAAAEKQAMSHAMLDRLHLNGERIEAMARGVETEAMLPDPLGRTLAQWTRPNGLHIARVSVPLGVIGIIYERSEEHTSELQSQSNLVCRLLLEKKN